MLSDPPEDSFIDGHDDFAAAAKAWGAEWRESRKNGRETAPEGVCVAWTRAMEIARGLEDWTDLRQHHLCCWLLIAVVAAADEASVGVGVSTRTQNGDDQFLDDATFELANDQSLTQDARLGAILKVLPKQHTPQRGLTLRSLSHHLALLPESEVETYWIPPPPMVQAPERSFARAESFNVLIAPWPLEVLPAQFTSRPMNGAPARFRVFGYERTEDLDAFANWLSDQIERGASLTADGLDMIVFPECSLTPEEFGIAAQAARAQGAMLIAGVHDTSPPATNYMRMDAAGIANHLRFRQRKHHRWCLDGPQVRGYGLSARLPSDYLHWEDTELAERQLSFWSFENWLTMSALICEDLARQDPVMETLRAVGPNLLVGLLMDGPQLASRWAGIRGAILADDPGISVLTVTSLGASMLSRRAGKSGPEGTRTVACWTDRAGSHELTLAAGAESGLLVTRRQTDQEYTADGRGDGGVAFYPTFESFTSL